MNLEDIVNDYTVDYIKQINRNNTKYDINDFSNLMDTLYGGISFYINGEEIEFTNDNKLNDDEINDILIDIYENLSSELKEQFMNEILSNSKSVPYKTTVYFEKIKQENKETKNIDIEEEEEIEEQLEEENNNDYDNSLVDDTIEPNVIEEPKNTEEIEEQIEEEISFDNGIEITKYEEETLALENEIKELENKYNNLLNSNIVSSSDNNNLIEEYEKLKNKIELTELNPEDNMYPEFEQDKIRLRELEEQINNLPENKNIKLKEEYERLKNKIELTELNPEDNMYPEFEQDKIRLRELEKLQGKNGLEISSVEKELGDKKQELEERKANIQLYYECLEDIKKLYNDVKNGLDTNSEEFANRVHEIDQKKINLPDPLKQELTDYLMKIKNNEKKKPIPIDKIEKNPKLTWKTFAFLAGGLGLGAAIGFTVGTAGLIIANVGLAAAKYFVNKKRKEAREKRLNGENEIISVEEPDNKLKATMQKFKNYIKSEEGLRDISWGLTGGLIGLNVGHMAKNIANTQNVATESVTQNAPTNNAPANSTPTVENNPYSDIKIGNNVGNHNVSVGHDTANWAVNNTNAENLIGQYVNGDSVFQRFAVMNPDGSVAQIINSNGMSINDLIANGIDPSSIAVDVGKNGVSQAWINVTELTKDIASVGRSLH